MKITIVAGARPNFMKIAPIIRAIGAAQAQGKRIFYRLVYTGSKDDASLDASLFADLNMKAPDVYLGVTGNNPTELTAGIMIAFERELAQNPAHVVLVVDDLTSTMSCAIVAKKQNIIRIFSCKKLLLSLKKEKQLRLWRFSFSHHQ